MNNPEVLIMVRPANFGFNDQTADSNKFQNFEEGHEVQNLALREFDAMVNALLSGNLDVRVIDDSPDPKKPDAIFPNNWISLHPDGTKILYPMEAPNRRLERRPEVLGIHSFGMNNSWLDLTYFEQEGKYLEGTGSIIFDHQNRVAYCAESSRSNIQVFETLCAKLGFRAVSFLATDLNGFPIYHTNVMLSIGDHVVVICSESIENPIERTMVLNALKSSKKTVVEISLSQMTQFAANCLEVNDVNGNPVLVMSETARHSLNEDQLQTIEKEVRILSVPIPTIEKIGGGSARCMLLGAWKNLFS